MANSKSDKTILILTHLLALFTGFLGPLIILLVTEDKEAKNHAKMALNWQFSLIIYFIISFVLILVLIGIVFLIVLAILNVVFIVLAIIKANEGKLWRYPLSIPFFKV